jgi:hypothetical protein
MFARLYRYIPGFAPFLTKRFENGRNGRYRLRDTTGVKSGDTVGIAALVDSSALGQQVTRMLEELPNALSSRRCWQWIMDRGYSSKTMRCRARPSANICAKFQVDRQNVR